MIRTSLHHPRNHLWVARRQKEIISKTKQKNKTRFFLLQTVKVTLEVDSFIPSVSSSVLHLVYLYLSSCNRQQDCYKKDKKREKKSRKNENFPAFPRLFVISSRLVVNKKRVKKHVRAKISGNQWAVFLTVTDFRSPPSVENGVSGSRGLGSKRNQVSLLCSSTGHLTLTVLLCLTVPPSRSIKKIPGPRTDRESSRPATHPWGRVVILSVASSQRNRDKLQLDGLLTHPFSPTKGLELDCLPVVTKATLEVNNYLRRRELWGKSGIDSSLSPSLLFARSLPESHTNFNFVLTRATNFAKKRGLFVV